MQKQLTDAEGQVFVTIAYDQDLDLAYTQWQGEQTDETVRKGAKACLETVQQYHTLKFLNDSSLVTGTWHTSNAWIAENLFPKAVEAGLKYMAFVLPTGLEGKISIVDLHQLVGDLVIMKVFMSPNEALDWLKSLD